MVTSADVIQQYSSWQLASYGYVAAPALFLYDTMLTMNRELCLVWRRKLGLGTILYLMARYSLVLVLVGYNIIWLWPSSTWAQTCRPILTVQGIIGVIASFSMHGLMVARVYAICNFRRWLALFPLLFLLGYVLLILIQILILFIRGCDNHNPTLVLLANMLILLFDSAVFIITCLCTSKKYFKTRKRNQNQETFTELLFKQGTIRFGIIFTWVLASIIMNKFALVVGNAQGPVENAVSAILVCRFHLDLLEHNAHIERGTTSQLGRVTLPRFRAAVRRMVDSLDDEFGYYDISPGRTQITQETQQNLSSDNTEINVEEFPWAIGITQHVDNREV